MTDEPSEEQSSATASGPSTKRSQSLIGGRRSTIRYVHCLRNGLGWRGAILPACLMTCVWASAGIQFVDQTNMRFPQPNLLEYSSQVALADIDGDGDQDIAFANGRGYNSATLMEKVRVFVNNGSGVFTDQTDARTGGIDGYGRDVQFGDVDGNGTLDMVVANDFATKPFLLLNDGNGFFTDVSTTQLPQINLGSPHVCLGDVENDGDLDLYFPNGGSSRFGSGQNHLWINDGTGVFTNETVARLPQQNVSQPMDCIFGDIDGDFDLDILVGNRASNSKLFLNNGQGVFTDVTAGRLPANGTTYSWDFGDIDADGDLDALGANSSPTSSREALFVNNGSGFFADMSNTLIPGANNPAVDDNDSKFFDYDDDGDLDFIIASLGSSERICANTNGHGQFALQSGVITAVGDSSLDVEVGDLDGDGRLDVVTAQGESQSFINRVFMNNGPVDTRPPHFAQVELWPDITDPVIAEGPYVVRAIIRDGMTSDRGFIASSTVLVYSINCAPPVVADLFWAGHDLYRGVIPPADPGSRISYHFEATDAAGNTGSSVEHLFHVLAGSPGDVTGDAHVDLQDVAAFQRCFTGGFWVNSAECATVDLIAMDCVVSLDDYAWFRLFLSGP